MRLATVHFRPSGKSPRHNCEEYAPLIAEAAQQKADLVVLGETSRTYGTGKSYADCAEPIPGPSTEYFGELAKKHNLYIVAGLLERDRHLVYNVAVLLGPDGNDRRQVPQGLPAARRDRARHRAGATTIRCSRPRFGKVGMMVCYDGFFPEVARELTNRGAEVIAWPVWGCNPTCWPARACENHVYVVSSTYEDVSRNWMISAVFDHDGKPFGAGREVGHGGRGRGGPGPAGCSGTAWATSRPSCRGTARWELRNPRRVRRSRPERRMTTGRSARRTRQL